MVRITVFLLLLLATPCVAQEAHEAIELILADAENEEDAELLGERLNKWAVSPLDINQATAQELSCVPYFDDFFIRNLLLERSRQSGFKSIYDLKHVQGAPLAKLPLLEPFLTVQSSLYESSSNRLKQSLYLGSEHLLKQHKATYNGIGWGIRYVGSRGDRHAWNLVAESDRGEPTLPFRQGIADYLSASYRFHTESLTLIVGDYRVNSGLGLLLGQGLSYFSKAEITGSSPSVSNRVISPHTSFREYGFLRGVSATQQIENLQITLFYGIEPIDARIESKKIRTLYYDGMHRSTAERAHRHTAQLHNAGGVVSYRFNHLELGATLLAQHFRNREHEPILAPDRFKHKEKQHTSAFYLQYLTGNWKLSGETLLERKERLASTLSLSYFADLYGTFTLSARYLGVDQFTPYGRPDSYYSIGRNERGIQLIWRGELARWWSGMLFADVFQKLEPERKTGTQPSFVLTLRGDYNGERSGFQSRLRLIKLADQPARSTLRLTHQYRAHSRVTIRSGMNLSYDKGLPITWGLSSRIQYGGKDQLRAELGVHYFDATQCVVRADQPWMPHRYYAPMLRGRGLRTSMALRYPITASLLLQGRSSLTWYQTEPTTPIPSLLDASLLIQL